MSTYPSLRIEGGLFSPDLLEALQSADLPGQKAADFGLPASRSLTNEIAAIFNDARTLWQVFQHRLERLPENDLATSETREFWAIPFLRLLGYDLHYNTHAYQVDGLTFAISHRAGEAETAPPVHIVGWRQELGRLAPSGRPRLSPHALVQEYLNCSEALWGLVTNGRILRLLRSSTFIRRQAYVEFDLEMIFEENRFSDFVLLYRLLHRTRLPADGRAAESCLLETYYQQSLEQGGRVRDRLREGVEQCLTILANGFLQHPHSQSLRQWVQKEGAQALYRQLLQLVYRFLFLLVAEERGLMGTNLLYLQNYGVTRLRRLCENRAAYTEDEDLWLGLCTLWKIFQDESLSSLLGVPPLNGNLFAHQKLDEAHITNHDLLEAFRYLAFYDDPPRRVNYAALDTEELGSVYESLLDYYPIVDFTAGNKPRFEFAPGTERKSTGSYYTPPQLVNELIRSALEPVIEERLSRLSERDLKGREQALLSIKICDPACGSGHFLLAAARRLGKELARIRTGEDEPAPERVREATRDVIAHCIYGVDKNPLAVELTRVALWIEGHAEGKPLTFLDHRIKCGDSLVGVFDLNLLKAGIPDEAFEPLEGDDKRLASSLKRQNKAEREGQMSLFGWNFDPDLSGLAALGQELDSIPDDSPEAVNRKRARYTARLNDPAWKRQKDACDLWTAAFFQSFTPVEEGKEMAVRPGEGLRAVITTDTVRRALAGQPVLPQVPAQANAMAEKLAFFHWPLEFPEVFDKGGFDVVLGNPPWERIKLQEQEFFAARDARIADAPNAAARRHLIEDLERQNPALWEEYRRALHTAESTSRFLRGSGHYPLTGRGDINTYSVFAERARDLLAPAGRAGLILPTGIATDATNQYFFADLVEKGQLVSLFDFENREKLFPAVDSRMKFCLLTLHGGFRAETAPSEFVFFATRTDHLRDPRRLFQLTRRDIARINPNTRTLPVFRTRQDADLTRAIYARVPVLVNEHTGENPWGVRFLRMLDMSNDSHLFRTRAELEAQGYRLVGNRFVPPSFAPSGHGAEEGEASTVDHLPRPSRELIERARQLRRSATRAEALLWELLRDRQLLGQKFRRQHPIGPFIADFFCDEARLVIEIDGDAHRDPDQREHDRLREQILRQYNLHILRFTNQQVLQDTEAVLQSIASFLAAHSHDRPNAAIFPLSQGFGRGGQGGEGIYLPLYEAKMIWHYDHRYGTYEGVADRSSTQLPTPDERQHADPAFLVQPWYWVDAREVEARLGEWKHAWLLGFRNITNATNERSAIFSLFPIAGVGNSLPVLLVNPLNGSLYAALYASVVSLAFDWVVRQKLAGVNMNFFYIQQFPVLPPEAYTPADLRFIVPRVLELTYTAWDLKPFADDLWRDADDDLRTALLAQWEENHAADPHLSPPAPSPLSHGEKGEGKPPRAAGVRGESLPWKLPAWIAAYPEIVPPSPAALGEGRGGREGFPLPPFQWNSARRARLQAELDAYCARLYGLTRKQLRYILDPADLTARELEDILDPWEEVTDPLDPAGYAARVAASDFPGETFRVLKEKEIRQYGEYRTRRLVLEAWERLCAEAPAPSVPTSPPDAVASPSVPTSAPPSPAPQSPSTSDYSLYRCGACGSLVMGFDRENHVRTAHGGQQVQFEKVR